MIPPTDFLHWKPSEAMLAKAKRLKTDSYIGRHKPDGYAAAPGTGPDGQTCKTCAHCHAMKVGYRRTVRKCLLIRARWRCSVRTDILLKSPACRHWKANPAQPDEKPE